MLSTIGRYLKGLYNEGKIDEINLDNAISKSWITTEEKNEIAN